MPQQKKNLPPKIAFQILGTQKLHLGNQVPGSQKFSCPGCDCDFVCNCVCMSTRRSSLPSGPSALTARVPGGNVTSSSQPTNAKVRHVIATKTIQVNFRSSLKFMYKFPVFLFQYYIYIKPTLVSSHG